jgi:hypothetical protein
VKPVETGTTNLTYHGRDEVADLLPPATIDDGPTITRVGARIKDLRDAGHTIRNAGTRDGFTVYVIYVPEPPSVPSQGRDALRMFS